MSGNGAVEVWRGDVPAWECDEMGHLNVRFHLARAMQGLAGVSAALGMPHGFASHAAASLIVREHHVRFLREARLGAPLHMTAGVVDMDEAGATLLQTLIHSRSGLICATFLTRIGHVAARDGRPFPWPDRARQAAEALKVEITEEFGPRGITEAALDETPSVEKADALGLAPTARSVVTAQDCDVFGRMRTELVIGQISQGISHIIEPVRAAAAQASEPGVRVGGAALEHRLVYFDAPRAGAHLQLRSGLVAVGPKLVRMRHWLLDPVSGAAWAAIENLSVNFDLDTRKTISLPPEAVTQLQGLLVAP